MNTLPRNWAFVARYWRAAASSLLCLVIANLATLAYPQLIRRVIDGGIVRQNLKVVFVATLGLILVAVLRGTCGFLQLYLSARVSEDFAYDVRNALYAKLNALGFSYHDQAQTGQLLTRMTNDVELLRQYVPRGFLQLVGAMAMMIGSIVILLVMNWRLGLLAFGVLILNFVIFGRFVRIAQPLFGRFQAQLGTLNMILEENLGGIRVVKAFAREPYERERYRQADDELLAEGLGVVRATSTNYPVIMFVANLGLAVVVWYGGNEVIHQTLTLGQLVAFMTYLNLLLFPVFAFGVIASLMARAGASSRRIWEVLDADLDLRDRPDAIELPPLAGRIEFRDVAFRYVGSDRMALEFVSFAVEPGQTVAIVGTTGSGKSTIAHLVPRFYDPTEGEVRIDDHDLRKVSLASLRRQVGVVLQDTMLFRGTIRDNIAFGRPDATIEEVVTAAQAAQAHAFIAELTDGYDTELGEGGSGLSGGQRQRLAIARAVLMNPRILILDDSTSSVDAETEYRLQESLDRLIADRTTLIIAHRVSSVRRADLILVVDQAHVIARGTHDALLESSSLYAEIVASQLRDDARPVAAGGRD